MNQNNLSNILNNPYNNMSNMNYNNNGTPNNLNHEFIRSTLLSKKFQNNPANYDILIEMILEDLLVENVFELQEIEEKQERLKQKENMKSFIKDYYKNFDDIKKLEDKVFDKLNSHDYGIRLNPQNQVMLLDGKDDRRHIIYKNPFASAINKSIDELHKNSLIIVDNNNYPTNDTNKNITTNNKTKNNTKNTLTNKSTKNNDNRKTRSKDKNENKNNKSNRSKSKDSKKGVKEISSPKSKTNNTSISINNTIQEQKIDKINSIPKKEDNEIDLQEKIKQNFINHLLTTNYDFDDNKANGMKLKVYYSVKPHKNLPEICEKYKKDYDDYMKTTGVFFVPNVFMLYEDVVNKLTNEIFEECVSKSLKELDEMALNIVKNEVEKDY